MRRHRCHRCGATVATGPDADILAVTVTVDTVPLSRYGECVAVINGRTTYTLDSPRRAAQRIEQRGPSLIGQGEPWDVVVCTHTCEPIPADWTIPIPQPAAKATDERCPF